MDHPFFYISEYDASKRKILLDEENSKHVVQVLRMKTGDRLNLTDGKGNFLTAAIVSDHKKHCEVRIEEARHKEQGSRKISIAISLLKNSNRFEWFLEKATEIGINEIIPLICERTEKEKFRYDRMKGICISAILQSQQCWLPVLHEPIAFKEAVEQAKQQQKFIAHCMEDSKRNLSDLVNESLSSQIILIGPEGDFIDDEIQLAIKYHFDAVSLGETRLRTETAGVVAATLLM